MLPVTSTSTLNICELGFTICHVKDMNVECVFVHPTQLRWVQKYLFNTVRNITTKMDLDTIGIKLEFVLEQLHLI